MRKIPLLFFVSMGCMVFASCQTKPHAEAVEVGDSEVVPEVLGVSVKNVLDGDVNADFVIPFEKEDILVFDTDNSGRSTSFRVHDLKGDNLLLSENGKAYIFNLSSRKLVEILSNFGKGWKEDDLGSQIFFSNNGDSLYVMESNWKQGTKIYGNDHEQNSVKKIEFDEYIGSIMRETDSTYLATNGVSAPNNDGTFYLYRLNNDLEKVDSVVLPKVIDPLQTFNKKIDIQNDGRNNVFLIKNTLYSVSENLEVRPYIDFDFEIPDTIKVSDYANGKEYSEAIGEYLLINDLEKIGNLLFCVGMYKTEPYYSIIDSEDSRLLYNVKGISGKNGVTFCVNDTEFSSWPIGKVWNGNILFKVPGTAIDKLYGKNGSSNGILMIPVEKFAGYF